MIRLSHTNNMFKYNSIFKLNELITFRIILFSYNLLHNNYNINLDTFFIYNKRQNKIYFTINENNEISKYNFF